MMHTNFGGYHISDVEVVAAFDINTNKIGHDVADAIFAKPNSSKKFSDVPELGIEVLPGHILDGVAEHMREPFFCYDETKMQPCNVADELKSAKADMLINYLPVGSAKAARNYAQSAIDAGTAFINCIPEFVFRPLCF